MTLAAIILDVDGTIAETEEAHRAAFNRAFAEAGHDWDWTPELYRRLLKVTGGKERIAAYLASIGTALSPEQVAAIHLRKNAIYAELVAAGEVAPRPGIARLVQEARAAGVKLGIATTTSRSNLDALLRATALGPFDAIVTGEDVAAKKPDPEVYERALAVLGAAARTCVAIEDSRAGLDAALACGLAVVATPSLYTDDHDFAGAALVTDTLDGPPLVSLDTLRRLAMQPA